MKTRYFFFAVTLFAVISQSTILADPPAKSSVGEVQIQTLKGCNYAYVSMRTTLNQLQGAIGTLMPRIDAAVDSGALKMSGPYIFTYHGATGERDKWFTLDIGVMVKDETKAPDGIHLIKLDPLHCATLLYTGPASQLQQAYGKLYGEIGRRGLQPTDVCREVYLYWEGPDSVNNVIQLQAALPAAQ